jgi:hypothetical protein
MAICGCGSSACCCQPAVAGGVIYADLRGELSTHLALQALFTQSSPVHEPLLQAFPFPSTLGEVTLHPISQACVFIYSHVGSGSSPSPVKFSSLRHSHQLSRSWLLGALSPLPLEPLQPGLAGLFTVPGRIPLPPSVLSAPHPLSHVSLLFLLLITQFLFFPRVGSVCPGGYADLAQGRLWKY